MELRGAAGWLGCPTLPAAARPAVHGWPSTLLQPASCTLRCPTPAMPCQVSRGAVALQLTQPVRRGDGLVFDAGRPQEAEQGGQVYDIQDPASGTSLESGAPGALWGRLLCSPVRALKAAAGPGICSCGRTLNLLCAPSSWLGHRANLLPPPL